MCALFIGSFAVTHWVIRADATTTAAPVHQNALAGAGPVADAPSASTDNSVRKTADTEEPEPPSDPAPSLQDLATDNDPETRGEAQALLGLLDQERASE